MNRIEFASEPWENPSNNESLFFFLILVTQFLPLLGVSFKLSEPHPFNFQGELAF